MSAARIFLDVHATTPTDPKVVDAMLPWLHRAANSHSAHAVGGEAADAVERARAQVAALIGADPDEIVFVPSATIAANIALRSRARPGTVAARSAIEHPCVVETLADLEPGVRVTEVQVGEDRLVDPEEVGAATGKHASVVAVMCVNNEVGTIQPIAEVADVCDYLSVPLVVDLAQAAGRIPVNVHAQRVAAGAVYLARFALDAHSAEMEAAYIKGAVEQAPAVISLNTLAASAAMNEFVLRAPFRLDLDRAYARNLFSLASGEEDHLSEDSFQAGANALLGRGPSEPLLGLPALAVPRP